MSSVFYRKNNVRQGACEKQMLSAGCGVATLDMYMNYNKKPKASPEESHCDRIIQHHSYQQKKQTLKTCCTEICFF